MLGPIFLIIPVFYFMVIKPAGDERKKHAALIDALKRGDEVITNSGLLGKITDISDSLITLEVARNVKVRMLKTAVTKKYVEPEEGEKQAAKA